MFLTRPARAASGQPTAVWYIAPSCLHVDASGITTSVSMTAWNEWAGCERVVPLCLGELCTDEHIPEGERSPINLKKKVPEMRQQLLCSVNGDVIQRPRFPMSLGFADMPGAKFNIVFNSVFPRRHNGPTCVFGGNHDTVRFHQQWQQHKGWEPPAERCT